MLVPPHVAPEDALEWFFDHYIADKPPTDEEESNEEEKKKVTQEVQPDQNKTEEDSTRTSKDPTPEIRNVVCSASLNCSLNLMHIVRTGKNVEYIKRFEQVQMRLRSPRATAKISADGCLTVTGVSSVDGLHTAARRVARIIQKMGFPVSFSNFRVHNYVLTYHIFPVSLERLYVALPGHRRSYEPELFSGLFFHSGDVMVCAFHTGAVIVTGSADLNVLTAVFRRTYPALCQAQIHHKTGL